MLCRITDSLRANATRALPGPDRFAITCAQSFRLEARLTRVRITTAASYSSVRASVSPHLDILAAAVHLARLVLPGRQSHVRAHRP